MHTIEVKPSIVHYHALTGKVASLFGAVPWFDVKEAKEWQQLQAGWTWRVVQDGRVTYGIGRKPAETREEAIEIAERYANATGAVILKTTL